jgi:hypothetical protein
MNRFAASRFRLAPGGGHRSPDGSARLTCCVGMLLREGAGRGRRAEAVPDLQRGQLHRVLPPTLPSCRSASANTANGSSTAHSARTPTCMARSRSRWSRSTRRSARTWPSDSDRLGRGPEGRSLRRAPAADPAGRSILPDDQRTLVGSPEERLGIAAHPTGSTWPATVRHGRRLTAGASTRTPLARPIRRTSLPPHCLRAARSRRAVLRLERPQTARVRTGSPARASGPRSPPPARS